MKSTETAIGFENMNTNTTTKSELKRQAIELGIYSKIDGKAPTKEMLIEMIHSHLIIDDTATVIDSNIVTTRNILLALPTLLTMLIY